MGVDQARAAEQALKGVGKPLDLQQSRAGDRTAGADDRVAGAHKHAGIPVDRPRAVLELPDEAVVHAAKLRVLGLAQVEVGEKTPDADGQVAHQRLLDAAEPPHEPGRQAPRNAVGQQEVEVLLLQDVEDGGADRHAAVKSMEYTAIRWDSARPPLRSTRPAPPRWRPRCPS